MIVGIADFLAESFSTLELWLKILIEPVAWEKLENDKGMLEEKARDIGMQKDGEEIFRFKESDGFWL